MQGPARVSDRHERHRAVELRIGADRRAAMEVDAPAAQRGRYADPVTA